MQIWNYYGSNRHEVQQEKHVYSSQTHMKILLISSCETNKNEK